MCSGWREVRAQRLEVRNLEIQALLENEVKKRAEPERASGCKTLASRQQVRQQVDHGRCGARRA